MPDAPTGPNNRSNPYYAKKDHVKLARVDSNRIEFFGTLGGTPTSPITVVEGGVIPIPYSYHAGDTMDSNPQYYTAGDWSNYESSEGAVEPGDVSWLMNGANVAAGFILSEGDVVTLRVTDSLSNERTWVIDDYVDDVAIAPTVGDVFMLAPDGWVANETVTGEAVITGTPAPSVIYSFLEPTGVDGEYTTWQSSTNPKWVIPPAAVGVQEIYLRVEATNAGGSASTLSAAAGGPILPAVMPNTPPTVDDVALTGPTVVGNLITLNATIGGKPTPTVTYTIRDAADDSVLYTGPTNNYTTTTVGRILNGQVTATNSEGTTVGDTTVDFGPIVALGALTVTATATSSSTAQLVIENVPLGATAYWYVSTSATPPATADLKSGAGAVSSGNYVEDGISAHPGPDGLTPETTYWAHVMYNDGADSAIVNDTFDTLAVPAAPVLSLPTLVAVDETTLRGGFTTTELGTFYYVLTNSAVAPSEAQIRAGTDENDVPLGLDFYEATSVLVTGTQVLPDFDNLSDTLTYYMHAFQDGTEDAVSNIISSTGAQPADVTAPVLSSLITTVVDDANITATVNSDSVDGTIYMVASTSATAPTPTQIIAGQDHTGSAAAASDSQPADPLGLGYNSGFAFGGLTEGTSYWVHATHQDAAGNDADTLSSVENVTDSSTVFGTWWATGEMDGATLVNGTSLIAQPDPFGGNNGVSIANDGGGAGSQISYIRTPLGVIFPDGTTVCRVYVKSLAGDADRWTSVDTESVSPGGDAWVNITDDGRDDSTRVGTLQGPWTNVSCSSVGDGWFLFQGTIDLTGGSDFSGRLQVRLVDANNSSKVDNTVAGAYSLGVHNLTIATE